MLRKIISDNTMSKDNHKNDFVPINEGTLKKNLNPPPQSERPPAPKAQVVAPIPQPTMSPKNNTTSQSS